MKLGENFRAQDWWPWFTPFTMILRISRSLSASSLKGCWHRMGSWSRIPKSCLSRWVRSFIAISSADCDMADIRMEISKILISWNIAYFWSYGQNFAKICFFLKHGPSPRFMSINQDYKKGIFSCKIIFSIKWINALNLQYSNHWRK